VIAAVGVHSMAAAADAERARWGDSRTVAVATRDLAAGTAVEPADVELRRLPRAALPPGAVTEAPVGRLVTAPTYSGEVLDERGLAPHGSGGVAALVPDGHRAVAVPTDPSTVPTLVVGDRVDVVVATDAFGGQVRPSVAAAGATVVDLGDESVTVALPEHEAPAVAVAAAGGLVALTLAGATP
jgi:Flp pilus assembly protein CpaB